MNKTGGIPINFVFNMDEMGHQDCANGKVQTCTVPATHADDHVYIPSDGSFLRPTIIIPGKHSIYDRYYLKKCSDM
jgi:hypothetical protein